MKLKLITLAYLATLVVAAPAMADRDDDDDKGRSELDKATADVSMEVALYAEITKLDDLTLETNDVDGAANSLYKDSEKFTVESNGPIVISVSGDDMKSEKDGSEVDTDYEIDGKESVSMDARGKKEFNLGAEAKLGDISDQSYGDYEGEVTVTVAAANVGSGHGHGRDRD